MKQRHHRPVAELHDDEIVVIRGGALDATLLRTDALRNAEIYGVFGVSVFAVLDATVDELAQHPPLVRFALLTLMRVGDLRSSGLSLEPTGRNPDTMTSRSMTSTKESAGLFARDTALSTPVP
jgi:hypothetical protein